MRLASVSLLFVCSAALSGQETIVLTSGLAPLNALDPSVTFLAGPLNAAFPAPFQPADFAAAQAGPAAWVTSLPGGWLGSLPSAPTARWVATDLVQGNQASALFAVNFNVASTEITSATVDLVYAMDDFLGAGTNQGVYVNGFAVSGTRDGTPGAYITQVSQTGVDITPYVTSGSNILYLYLHDTGGAGGLCFEARITVRSTLRLRQAQSPFPGGTGILELRAPAPLFGGAFVLLPSFSLLPGGVGFNVGSGTVWQLDPTDPLLVLALTDPGVVAPIFPVLGGTLSPLNGGAVSPIFLPPNPALLGLVIQWQSVGLLGGVPVQASNVLTTVVGL